MDYKEWFKEKSIVRESPQWGGGQTMSMEEEMRYQAFKARLLSEVHGRSQELLYPVELTEIPDPAQKIPK
jgi:hypothetical protein